MLNVYRKTIIKHKAGKERIRIENQRWEAACIHKHDSRQVQKINKQTKRKTFLVTASEYSKFIEHTTGKQHEK